MPIANAAPATTVADPVHTLYHKITWKLIPFLCFCYLAAYLDRINIGFAKLQMLDQLHFSETAFGLGAGLFFVGYIIFEVPSNLILEKVGAKIWIARIMITWGLLSACTMLVTSTTQFYILRFLLGAAEAGFLPGVLYYLTTWFPTHRRGRIIALFMIGLPLSSVIGGPLSGWIMGHFDNMAGLRGWQWLFLIEAVPSVLLGVWTFWALPNTYQQAKWLSPEEKPCWKANCARTPTVPPANTASATASSTSRCGCSAVSTSRSCSVPMPWGSGCPHSSATPGLPTLSTSASSRPCPAWRPSWACC